MASATGTQQERMVHANKTWVEQRQQTNSDASYWIWLDGVPTPRAQAGGKGKEEYEKALQKWKAKPGNKAVL